MKKKGEKWKGKARMKGMKGKEKGGKGFAWVRGQRCEGPCEKGDKHI